MYILYIFIKRLILIVNFNDRTMMSEYLGCKSSPLCLCGLSLLHSVGKLGPSIHS